MTQVTLKNNPCQTVGILPPVGSSVADVTLVKTDLSQVSLKDFQDQTLILNIFPSMDTGTCAMSVRKFNEEAVKHPSVKVLCISADLPFAQSRFCAAEGIENVISLSTFRDQSFGEAYGTTLADGPLQGLQARAVIIIKDGIVAYTQLVSEITNEPDYDDVFKHLD